MGTEQDKDICCKEFMQLVQLILDDEASAEQKAKFEKHADGCHPCKEHYHIDKSIIALIKQKLDKKEVPSNLAEKIRAQIIQMV